MKSNARSTYTMALGIALAGSSLVAQTAHAQAVTGTATTASSSDQTSADIVVTATRSETTAQKTPVALTVYGGSELLDRDIHTLNVLQTIDPSLQITQQTGTPYVGIRGIESTNTTEVGNPSVSVARDGFFVNRTYSLSAGFYDLERVEILKGPQGTLFGRNSTGGLINLISAKPNFNGLSGYANATVGDYTLFGGEAALNLPVNDQIAFRFSGFGRTRDGYREVTGINIRGDDDRLAAGRAQVLVKPTSYLDILLEYNHDYVGGVGDVTAVGPIGVPFTGNAKSFVGYQPVILHIDVDHFQWNFTLHDLPLDGTLTYQGGTDLTRYLHTGDSSGFDQSGRFAQAQFTSKEHVRTTNNEIRFATSEDRPFYFQVGGFFFTEHNNLFAGQITQSGGFVGQPLVSFITSVETTSRAAFGQASYRLTDKLTLTGGARETWDYIERNGISLLRCDIAGIPAFLFPAIGCLNTPPTQTTIAQAAQRENKLTYRVGADWQVTPDNLLYAKYDTGYQPGGFSQDPSNPNLAYGPQTVKAVEIGSKNQFFGRKLTFNIDGFYQTLNGYQASRIICPGGAPPTLGCPAILANVGTVTSYGIEAQANAKITPTTQVDTNVTWLHARFAKNLPPVSDLNNGIADISGNTLPNAPSFVWTGGITQTIPLSKGSIVARLDGKYSTRLYFDYLDVSDTSAAPYFMGNVSLTYRGPAKNWSVQVYLKNFTDETVFSRITRSGIIRAQQFEFQAPRTVGGQVSYRF